MKVARFCYISDWFKLLKIVQNNHNIINYLSKKEKLNQIIKLKL